MIEEPFTTVLARELYHALDDDLDAVRIAATLLGLVVARSADQAQALANAHRIIDDIALACLADGRVIH